MLSETAAASKPLVTSNALVTAEVTAQWRRWGGGVCVRCKDSMALPFLPKTKGMKQVSLD